jgi:hypothetical protein
VTAKTISARLTAVSCCAVALTSCIYSHPPQTEFYCVDIPEGRSAEAERFVQSVADRLDFKISKAQFPSEKGPPNHVWEVYGGGVSLFVGTALKDGKPDRYGNREATFNPNRLDFHVAKTGWWQRVRFEDVVATGRDSAGRLGWPFSKAAAGESCST